MGVPVCRARWKARGGSRRRVQGSQSKIAEAESEVDAFVYFVEEPVASGVGGEELDDGSEVERLELPVDVRTWSVAKNDRRSFRV